jgi:hypothetical protein
MLGQSAISPDMAGPQDNADMTGDEIIIVEAPGLHNTGSVPEAKDVQQRPLSKSSTSGESAKTNTSTIEFDHEPFETYIFRVRELCQSLWPNVPNRSRLQSILSKRFAASPRGKKLFHSIWPSTSKIFDIGRLRGGGFNRIIAINIINASKADPEPESLILRIPRFDDAKPESEVAVLRYVSQHTTLPVPKIKSLDFTTDNPLNSPYVINYRIPGHDLQHLGSGFEFPNLSHEQQCTVATEFAKALLQLQATTNATPGRIEAMTNGDGSQTFAVRPFEVSNSPSAEDGELDVLSHAVNAPSFESTLGFFLSQFGRWKDTGSDNILKISYMERLSAVASQMAAAGYLGENRYTLCHLDLIQSPRNIMVNVDADKKLQITGILDWDDAVFLPSFVGCVLPNWIWAWEGQNDDDENVNDDEPATPEQQELKRLFENAVGPEFLHQGRETGFRLPRRMIPWALHGIHATWDMKAVDSFLDDWAAYRPLEMPQIKRVLKADPDSYSMESIESEGSSNREEAEEGDEGADSEDSEERVKARNEDDEYPIDEFY